jgi:DNA repair photolyase
MPKGKAAEYAKYAVNFYVGCSNDCDYCYCKRGVLAHAMGSNVPRLKKCLQADRTNVKEEFWRSNDLVKALDIFDQETEDNLDELRKHGLFFSFSTDPCLKETWFLTRMAIRHAAWAKVPCKILTKRADFVDNFLKHFYEMPNNFSFYKRFISVGFTLTGCDEFEQGANTNAERIEAMRRLHRKGFRTFASIEPVINMVKSVQMIEDTLDCCDEYLIGLLSGQKSYSKADIKCMFWCVCNRVIDYNKSHRKNIRIYWKDSVLQYMGDTREDLKKLEEREPFKGLFL